MASRDGHLAQRRRHSPKGKIPVQASRMMEARMPSHHSLVARSYLPNNSPRLTALGLRTNSCKGEGGQVRTGVVRGLQGTVRDGKLASNGDTKSAAPVDRMAEHRPRKPARTSWAESLAPQCFCSAAVCPSLHVRPLAPHVPRGHITRAVSRVIRTFAPSANQFCPAVPQLRLGD